MTDRDRLIELVCKGIQEFGKSTVKCSADEYISDYLIGNGIIVSPCKAGDTVYIPKDDGTISESKVARIDITFMMDTGKNAPFDTWWLNEYNIGITSFLTREEAEKALKEHRK